MGNKLNETEVKAIASNSGSSSDHVIPVEDFGAMDAIIDQLVDATCTASSEYDMECTNSWQLLSRWQTAVRSWWEEQQAELLYFM